MGDGVGADVHAGGDLVVVQPLGDEAGHDPLGTGQAVPPGDGPVGERGPVAAADAELTQPPPDTGLVAVGPDLAVPAECFLQVVDRPLPVAVAAVQDAEVFCRGGPGPRIWMPRGCLGEPVRVTAGQAPDVGRRRGQGRDPGMGVRQVPGGARGARPAPGRPQPACC